MSKPIYEAILRVNVENDLSVASVAQRPPNHDRPGEVISLADFQLIRQHMDLGTIVATSGGFDPFHFGHGRSLLAARQLGDTLVVIVNGDSYLAEKKAVPFQDLATRCRNLCYVRGVDYVIPYEAQGDRTVIEALRAIRPHIFAKGGDRNSSESVPEMVLANEFDLKFIFGVGGVDKDVSSSDILADYRKRLSEKN